jgi:HEAT repeat protein
MLHADQSPSLLAGLDLLRRRPDDAMFGSAAALLSHDDDRVKRAALLALARFARVDAVTLSPLLGKLLHADDHTVRVAAVRCTQQLAAADCRELCFEALEDRHPRVVQAALEVLREIHGKGFTAMSLDWLDRNAGSPRAQRALVELLLKQPAPSGRLAAIVRGKLGEALLLANAQRLAEKACKDGNMHRGVELLSLALRESLERIVALALTALEGIEDRQLVRTVRAGLASKDPRQEARALEALEDLGARDIAASLRVIFGRGGARDRVSVEAAGPTLGTLAEVIEHFSKGRDAWLRDCADFARPAGSAGAI